MPTIPDHIRREVIQAIYRVLDSRRWEELSSVEKSAEYERMVEAKSIGFALAPYMDAARTRVWIKDGPAKEYGRALEGFGPYSEYTTRQLMGATQVVAAVLGAGWTVVEASVEDKPMRCEAVSADGERRIVMWAAYPALKDLAWQCLLTREVDPQARPALVIARRTPAPLPNTQRRHAERIAALAGGELFEVQRQVGRKLIED